MSTEEVGLSVNVDKTKTISHTRSSRPRQNLIIEEGKGFRYLGATISEDTNEKAEIRRKVTVANKAYIALITTFKSIVIHRQTKMGIYKSIIIPTLCYGS